VIPALSRNGNVLLRTKPDRPFSFISRGGVVRSFLGSTASILILSTAAFSAENEPIEVVSPALFDVGKKSATRPAEIISETELKTADRGGIQDSLNTLGGVQARTTGSPAISIRGSLNSSRTLVLSDGVPLNFSDGVGFNPILIADENLGEITLLRGPGSSLFGRDAMAGVIDFRSSSLTSPLFRSSFGSFGTSSVFAGAPFYFDKNTQGQITAYQTHTDGTFSYRIARNGNTGARTRNDSETTRST
jgi:outer membrane cobalamin receptor